MSEKEEQKVRIYVQFKKYWPENPEMDNAFPTVW
jgi:hypothetical protein